MEWIGGLAIVASLLLVAFEIRQNTNAIAAQAVFDLNQSANQELLMLAADPEMSRLVNLGNTDPDALNSEEMIRYRSYVWAVLNQFESAWVVDQRGIVNDEEIESWSVDYCRFISVKGVKRVMPDIRALASSIQGATAEWCLKDE